MQIDDDSFAELHELRITSGYDVPFFRSEAPKAGVSVLELLVLLALVLLATSGCISANLVTGKAMTHHETDPETHEDKQVEGQPGYYALLPLTVVGDIATSPFQLLYLCYTLDGDVMVWGPWP